MKALALISTSGIMHIDTGLKTEEELWRIFLGWPSKEEIERAKRLGAKVVEVEITIKEALK